jgi:RimJ/RimL family protein N-acetyltransferase
MRTSKPDCLPRSTPRLLLRRLASGDLKDFQAYRHDPEVGRYQGWLPTDDRAAETFLAEMGRIDIFQPGVWFQLGIADRSSGRLIGDIGICVAMDGNEAEIGFSLCADAQGRGLATEAVREAVALLFEQAGVARVVGITDARNLPSIRLLERVGMRRQQTVAALFRGEPCQEHHYAMAKDPAD